jgi:hypothetical protein
MSSPLRHLAIGGALTLVAFGGVLWQVEQSGALRPESAQTASGPTAAEREYVSLPRLICPFH